MERKISPVYGDICIKYKEESDVVTDMGYRSDAKKRKVVYLWSGYR